MNNQTMVERFEEAFLAGRSRENPIVSSLLHRGADGEYFNPGTRTCFSWFLRGAASADAELMKALERIARPMDCGCKPCTGQCTSREALLAELEACYEYASEAITRAKAVKP